jgi:DNA-binding GntR family transcriptional regulator
MQVMADNAPAPAPSLDRSRAASAQAYDWLRAEIIRGRLRPGQPLSENETASALGVSRTPVREAFVRLAGEGLLSIRPQVGTEVAPIDLDAVADSQFLREAIETRTVALASAHASAGDRRELARLLREQQRCAARKDSTGFLALDDALHQRLLAMAGRPRIWSVVETAKAHLDRVRHLSLEDPDWLGTIYAQHEDIVRRVVDHDAAGAARTMSKHLRTVFASIERIARVHPEWFRAEAGTDRHGGAGAHRRGAPRAARRAPARAPPSPR